MSRKATIGTQAIESLIDNLSSKIEDVRIWGLQPHERRQFTDRGFILHLLDTHLSETVIKIALTEYRIQYAQARYLRNGQVDINIPNLSRALDEQLNSIRLLLPRDAVPGVSQKRLNAINDNSELYEFDMFTKQLRAGMISDVVATANAWITTDQKFFGLTKQQIELLQEGQKIIYWDRELKGITSIKEDDSDAPSPVGSSITNVKIYVRELLAENQRVVSILMDQLNLTAGPPITQSEDLTNTTTSLQNMHREIKTLVENLRQQGITVQVNDITLKVTNDITNYAEAEAEFRRIKTAYPGNDNKSFRAHLYDNLMEKINKLVDEGKIEKKQQVYILAQMNIDVGNVAEKVSGEIVTTVTDIKTMTGEQVKEPLTEFKDQLPSAPNVALDIGLIVAGLIAVAVIINELEK